MENEAIGGRHYCQLSDLEIVARVESVCTMYGIRKAKLVWADLGRWAAEWDNGIIRLNRGKVTARSILTVLHELGHHLHACLGGDQASKHENHGPEFVACYMSILDTSRIIPVVGMRAICDAYKIRYKDPGTTNSLIKLQSVVRN